MELTRLNASEVASKVTAKELSCVDYVSAILERINRVEGKINSYITVTAESALRQAKRVDEKVKQGERLGALAGVAVAVKDNICTQGVRTTCASKMLENFIPPYNATVIERILGEDAVIIGKTNMDEFAMGSSTETSYFGPTHNPHDPERVPGGSSGGSASSLVALEATVSLGADTGGSVRCPASFCGVVGLKPTYGLVSRYGLIAYANSLEQIGPMARNVGDCALLLSAIAGYDGRDSTSASVEKQDYTRFLVEGVEGLRLGVVKELLEEGTSEEVREQVERAVSIFRDLGACSEEVSLPTLRYALPAYYLLAMSEASSNLARFDGVRYGHSAWDQDEKLDWNDFFLLTRQTGFGPEVKRRIILGTYALSAGYYDRFFLKALKVVTLLKREFELAFSRFDLLVGPTMPFKAFKIGEKIRDPLQLYMSDVDTVPINLVGVPAISIPCGAAGNLPLGLQLIAPHFREDLLLRAAYTFERRAGFDVRLPLM